MKRFITAVSFTAAVLQLLSCSILPDSSLEIISWSPGIYCPVASDGIVISITFNREPEPVCTEEAFSISADGIEEPGTVSFDACKLIYTPYSPLESNTEYELKLTAAAEDRFGYSLRDDFSVKFRTGPIDSRPEVTALSPEDKSFIDDEFLPVIITFDRPMNFDSILDGFSVSPDILGVSQLDSAGLVFTFTPAEGWEWQEEYTVGLSTKVESMLGYSIPEVVESVFAVGTDSTPPEIVDAASEDGTVELTASPSDGSDTVVNCGWEKDSAVRICFSEEVDRQSAEASVTIEPAEQFEISFDETVTPAAMILKFEDALEWHTLYRLAVSAAVHDLQDNYIADDGIFYLYIDGPSSQPPEISRVAASASGSTGFCLFDLKQPDAAVNNAEILDTSAGDATAEPWFIDYYFTLAENAELSFFDFAENFLISPGNSCVSINYLNFQLFNPGEPVASADLPRPSPSSDEAVVRLITSLTDSSSSSGSILFQVYSDLADSLGNSMAEDWTAELFDEDS